MTITEDSLSLASDYIRDKLRKERFEQALKFNDEISVDGLENCDCVPLLIKIENRSSPGWWNLVSCERKHISGSLSTTLQATYRWIPSWT